MYLKKKLAITTYSYLANNSYEYYLPPEPQPQEPASEEEEEEEDENFDFGEVLDPVLSRSNSASSSRAASPVRSPNMFSGFEDNNDVCKYILF